MDIDAIRHELRDGRSPSLRVNQASACPYCLVGAGINAAMVPAVLPEVVDGVRSLAGRRGGRPVRP